MYSIRHGWVPLRSKFLTFKKRPTIEVIRDYSRLLFARDVRGRERRDDGGGCRFARRRAEFHASHGDSSESRSQGLKRACSDVHEASSEDARDEDVATRSQSACLDSETRKIFEELSGGDAEKFKTLQLLKVRFDLTALEFGITPEMNGERWKEYLESGSVGRRKFLRYIFGVALRRERRKAQKLEKVPGKSDECEGPKISLFDKGIFIRIGSGMLRKMDLLKEFTAMVFSEEIYIDCSYEEYMRKVDVKYLGRQIAHMLSSNKQHISPYKIVFCNLKKDSLLAKYLPSHYEHIFDDNYPVVIHEGSFLDLCPKEKIVYLSPHSRRELTEYDPEARYVIGAYIDKSNSQPVSMAKAKELGLKTAKFPIERHLNWGCGSKSLALNHCLQIMLDLRHHRNDWKVAFGNLPTRFTEKHVDKAGNMKKTTRESSLYKYIDHWGEHLK